MGAGQQLVECTVFHRKMYFPPKQVSILCQYLSLAKNFQCKEVKLFYLEDIISIHFLFFCITDIFFKYMMI